MKTSRNLRRVLLTVALVAVVACASIGGTIAWLVDETGPVTNTFTVGDININLTETWNTDTNNDGTNDSWSAKMVPGDTYVKDPKVTVLANSEECWLFVEVTTTGSIEYIDYEINEDGWTKGTGNDGDGVPTNVYYRVVDTSTSDTSFYMLTDKATLSTDDNAVNGSIKISEELTKEIVNSDTFVSPTITFTAYACQKANVATAADAWAKIGA